LYIHIEDNGDGFDPEEIKSNGYGVQNIKERTEQLSGTYTLQSQPGEGAEWSIELPVA
jgi:signal transduction histidine kinase